MAEIHEVIDPESQTDATFRTPEMKLIRSWISSQVASSERSSVHFMAISTMPLGV